MTSEGTARADVAWPAGRARRVRDPAFLLVLTHGSGGEPESADLLAVRDAVLPLGAVVALVTQPYRVKGRPAPGPPARQDAAWIEIIDALRPMAGLHVPLVQGGRSNGARVACRTAAAAGARAVLALAFPLHPPGRPEKSRAGDLALAGTDVLVINGSRDPFGIPDQAARTRVVVLDGETHTLSSKPGTVGAIAAAWLADLPGLAHT
ncbi:MAG TPA: alpha/beta family hydrolase [Streptosporangiaceae bacterium]|nr:alpha/beta family hydrolase [Streptosporangiaceae bacterium]